MSVRTKRNAVVSGAALSLSVAASLIGMPSTAFAARAQQNAPPPQQPGAQRAAPHTEHTLALTFPPGDTISVKLRGTERLPNGNGEAKVERKRGTTEIEMELDDMRPASHFGGDLNTYVFWSISPEGVANNLAEIVLDGNRGKLNVSTRMETFGLIVTAEPHFMVRQPSRYIVLRMMRPTKKLKTPLKTAVVTYPENAGVYRVDRDSLADAPKMKVRTTPLAQAQTAVRLASEARAAELASKEFTEANFALRKAEEAASGDVDKSELLQMSQEVVRLAYGAQLAAESRGAELARRADAARAQEEAARIEEARWRAEEQRQREEEERKRAQDEQRRAEAEAARAALLAEQQRAQAEVEKARRAAEAALQEREALRAQLLEQFNRVLPTRDTERGLVVNMSDVLFDVGKADLRSGAREALARLAGIVVNYPGLQLSVEGHTDSTGTEEFNLRLSEQRAESVRRYLAQGGVDPEAISVVAYGEATPVADNSTAAGRQQNRRVEIVVSGEVIGREVSRGAPR